MTDKGTDAGYLKKTLKLTENDIREINGFMYQIKDDNMYNGLLLISESNLKPKQIVFMTYLWKMYKSLLKTPNFLKNKDFDIIENVENENVENENIDDTGDVDD